MSSEANADRRWTVAEVTQLIDRIFPQIHHGGQSLFIEAIGPRAARVRLAVSDRNVRPGGTISGPSMFTLADFGLYVALLGELGPAAEQAVTTNLTINFLARPEPRDIVAEVRLVKLGRRLAVGEVEMRSEGAEEMVAHAVATYALPGS